MHNHNVDNITPEHEPADGPTKWRREGHDRREPSGESHIMSDMEKRMTGDRRTRWLEFISRFIFPRGSRKS